MLTSLKWAAVAVAAFLAVVLGAGPSSAQRGGGTPGDFDFYVLALSWSPSFCEAEGAGRNDIQCARPFSFVVHGLWPQYDRGFPSNCAATGGGPDDRLVRSMLDIMPSPGLIRHEWQTHGTCSGLEPKAYFDTIRKAFAAVAIPKPYQTPGEPQMVDVRALESAFKAENKDLDLNEIAVTCDSRRLREVRVCLSKDLKFRACGEVDRQACRMPRVYVPAVRTGGN